MTLTNRNVILVFFLAEDWIVIEMRIGSRIKGRRS
jgi:hypothetical protein